jgi:hypothetical protein
MSSLNANYNPFPYNNKEIRKQDSLEYKIRWNWPTNNGDVGSYHEAIDDALMRATIVTALKLTFFGKYPKIMRHIPCVLIFCSAWYELRALISYETGKFFVNYGRRAACKFGCKKVLM